MHGWAHLTAMKSIAIDLSPFQLGCQSGIRYDLRARAKHMLNTTWMVFLLLLLGVRIKELVDYNEWKIVTFLSVSSD